MQIDTNISDLFFNTDLSDAKVVDEKGQFIEFDHFKLRAEAELFLGCLTRLGIGVPTVDELTADFYGRV